MNVQYMFAGGYIYTYNTKEHTCAPIERRTRGADAFTARAASVENAFLAAFDSLTRAGA